MNEQYIVALDQGTTSSRAVLFNQNAQIVAIEQKEFAQHFPKLGWVEHDANEIWHSQKEVFQRLLHHQQLKPEQIASIGITNQRETTVVWHRETGKPIYNAIVWQDRRTSQRCDALMLSSSKRIQQKTGLVIDAYFSATKLEWILDNVKDARLMAECGELAFGTIDSWLIWNLTHGKTHATDVSNASRTMLFNIETESWDESLLELFSIPKNMLPEVKDSADHYGFVSALEGKIPITGVAGDQQAALFGQACFLPGMVKNTYGTGCFLLMNTGKKRVDSQNRLLSTIAWRINGETTYALEGSVFIGGAAIQWLRDELEIIENASQSEKLAMIADENSEVVVVPAFTGLGAPHWDMYARGSIFGLTRNSGKAEVTRATLQSLALQVHDVLRAMQDDSNIELSQLNVDGGAIANSYLAQFQADILCTPVVRAKILESTALGAAALAAIHIGLWQKENLAAMHQIDTIFKPKMEHEMALKHLQRWNKAVSCVRQWAKD